MPHAYLQFGDSLSRPMLTLRVPAKETPTPRHGQTVSGYGARIPTCWMALLHGRWRRVYVARWGNGGSAYLGKPGAWLCTVTLDLWGEED